MDTSQYELEPRCGEPRLKLDVRDMRKRIKLPGWQLNRCHPNGIRDGLSGEVVASVQGEAETEWRELNLNYEERSLSDPRATRAAHHGAVAVDGVSSAACSVGRRRRRAEYSLRFTLRWAELSPNAGPNLDLSRRQSKPVGQSCHCKAT